MGVQPAGMVMVGRVIRVFHNLGCVGIHVTNNGFTKGQKLLIEATRRTHTNCEFVANSIQIDRQPVASVEVGDKCAVRLPGSSENLPPYGSMVFLAPNGG